MNKEEKELLCEIARIKAHEHWDFLSRWFTMVCIDVFEHGFKHGAEEMERLKEGDLK